jgi:hypothetical protein
MPIELGTKRRGGTLLGGDLIKRTNEVANQYAPLRAATQPLPTTAPGADPCRVDVHLVGAPTAPARSARLRDQSRCVCSLSWKELGKRCVDVPCGGKTVR